MANDYLPLRIAEQMRLNEFTREHAGRDVREMDEVRQIIMTLMTSEKEQKVPLDLDDFFSWTIGSTFLKRAYDSTYKKFNDAALIMYAERKAEKGYTYKRIRKELRDSITFAAMFRCFDQYRQAYRFDPDFVDELFATDTLNMPMSVLTGIPFRCFYLELENLPRFAPYAGCYVYIGWDEKNHLPNLALFRVMRPETDDGQVPIRSSILSGPDMVKWGVLYLRDDGTPYLRFTKDMTDIEDKPDANVIPLCFFILQAILYMVSSKPDIRKAERKKTPKSPRTDKQMKVEEIKPVEVSEVGVRYGKVIRLRKREMKECGQRTETAANRTRKPMASHVRSAHWHHYWTGKGRTTLIVKWIPPVFVSSLGKELPITIHEVKGE